MPPLHITTDAFAANGPIPDAYAKDGDNRSPALRWAGIPEGTVDMALSCVDPDAPSGTFIHWLVAWAGTGIDGCDEGKPPIGAIDGRNDYGDLGYGGPRPPVGDPPHRYFFRIQAFDRSLHLREGFTYEDLQRAADGSELASAEIMGTYQRP